MSTDRSQASVFSPPRSLMIAVLLLVISVALRLLTPHYISVELGQRLLGVLLGLLVVLYANAVPKTLLKMRGNPAAEQAMRRFTGIGLVLGGLAFAAAWVLAPIENAAVLSASLLGTVLLIVLVRIGWGMWKAPRDKAD